MNWKRVLLVRSYQFVGHLRVDAIQSRFSRPICIKTVLHSSKKPVNDEESKDKETPPPVPPPQFPTRDWIGPVDKRSNLRRVILAHPAQESDAERDYRHRREATSEWNHQFWAQQNERFIKAKEDFVKDRLADKKKEEESLAKDDDAISEVKQVLSAEEMAEFYQQFLKDNRVTFRDYNRQWYRRNFSLLWPAVRANLHRLTKMKR